MNRASTIPICITMLLAAIFGYSTLAAAEEPHTLKIGWQTAWATQGQVIQALAHTTIPELYKVNLIFLPFQYGPDQNEAALSGQIDYTNAGIVPVLNLLAKDSQWIAIARQVDFPISIVARVEAGIRTVSDLKGKRLGVPIGGGSHPYAFSRVTESGLSIGTGPEQVKVINVQPKDMPIAMKDGSIDAAAVWEPTVSLLVNLGGRVIDETRYTSFLMARTKVAEENRTAVVRLLKSLIEANFYVAHHRKETDTWFSEVSRINVDLIEKLKTIESNVESIHPEDVDIRIRPADIRLTQSVADKMRELNLLSRIVSFRDHVDMSFLNQALKELANTGYLADRVTIRP